MTFAKKLWHNWPDYFTVGVCIYLLVLAMDLGDRVPSDLRSSSNANSSSETTTTSTTSVPTAAGLLTFEVMAFRVVPDRENFGQLDGKFTVEVTNNTDTEVKFAPDAFVLRRNGANAVAPEDVRSPAIEVSPHVSQLVPVSFPLPGDPGGTYDLLYQGQEIFSGRPT